MKKIIMTGGGSAGHVNPNIALIPRLREKGFELYYVGRKQGIERELVTAQGIPYFPISAGKFRRYVDAENLFDVFRVLWGFIQSFFLVRRVHPDLVFSKGGFVACPLVWASWLNGVRVVIHESDITPGFATRLSIPFAYRVCFSFHETERSLPANKAIYTGIPIRSELLGGNADVGKALCAFADTKPVLLIIGGSQGAEIINKTVRAALGDLLKKFNVCHICGPGRLDSSFEDLHGYKQFEYAGAELPHLLAMTDVAVSRAGATTLFELLKLKKANLLIPLSLKASRGDQILNAQSFEKMGVSLVLREDELNVETLKESITKTHSGRSGMIEAMRSVDSINSTEKIIEIVENSLGSV